MPSRASHSQLDGRRRTLGLLNAADYYGLEQLRKACLRFVSCCITVDTGKPLSSGPENWRGDNNRASARTMAALAGSLNATALLTCVCSSSPISFALLLAGKVCSLLSSAERYIQYKCTKSIVQKVSVVRATSSR